MANTPTMLRRGLGPTALVAAVAVVAWLISGVALLDIVKFLAYDVGFVALPGAALLWAVRGRRSHFLVTIALGWPLGQALEILAFSGTAAIGLRGLFLLYPVFVIAPSALVILRRASNIEQDPDTDGMSGTLMWTAATMLSIGLIYLTILFLPQAPLPTSSVLTEYPDFPFFIGLITQVKYHWPPTNPGLAGVPLPYEWFVFFHMAATSQVTRLPVSTIALRLDYVPTIVVVGCELLAVGRFVGRSAWTGAIAIGVVFLLGPLDLIASPNGGPFGDSLLFNLWNSWTFPFGLMFFLALLYLITERLRANTWRTPGDISSWALIGLLMIGASGAKATVLPVVIAGIALYIVIAVLTYHEVPVAAMVTAAMSIVIFVATYLVVYSGNAPDTVIKMLVLLGGTPPVIFADGIHHALVRVPVLPFAYVAGLAGLMLPLLGIFYLLGRPHRHEFRLFLLPICMLVGGAVITNVVHQSSYSEGYFEETGYVAGAIAASAGLRLAWLDIGRALPVSRRAVFAICGLGGAAPCRGKSSRSRPEPRPTMVFYAGFVAAGLLICDPVGTGTFARKRFASGHSLSG